VCGVFLQISLSETLVWRAAEMVQRLDLTSLTAPEDEEHTEAATDVPMQMSLVSISSLAAKVRYAASGVAVSHIAQPLLDMRSEVYAVHLVKKCVQCAGCFTDLITPCLCQHICCVCRLLTCQASMPGKSSCGGTFLSCMYT